MSKIVFDTVMFLVMVTIPYLLATSRLQGPRANAALYEAAANNPGIRS